MDMYSASQQPAASSKQQAASNQLTGKLNNVMGLHSQLHICSGNARDLRFLPAMVLVFD
jgi:hypothetical protein